METEMVNHYHLDACMCTHMCVGTLSHYVRAIDI